MDNGQQQAARYELYDVFTDIYDSVQIFFVGVYNTLLDAQQHTNTSFDVTWKKSGLLWLGTRRDDNRIRALIVTNVHTLADNEEAK